MGRGSEEVAAELFHSFWAINIPCNVPSVQKSYGRVDYLPSTTGYPLEGDLSGMSLASNALGTLVVVIYGCLYLNI